MPTLAYLPTVRARIYQLFWVDSQSPAEWLTAARSISWALWFSCGAGQFASSPTTYRYFVRVMPEQLWALSVLAFGVVHLAIIFGGNRTARRWAAFVACLLWLFIGLLYLCSGARTAAPPTHLITALASGWAYLRLGGRPVCSSPE